MRADAPACVRCRDPWPGAVADAQLVAKCQQEHIPIQTSWEDWPDQPQRDLCDGMPGRPDHIPVFQVNTDCTRIQTKPAGRGNGVVIYVEKLCCKVTPLLETRLHRPGLRPCAPPTDTAL